MLIGGEDHELRLLFWSGFKRVQYVLQDLVFLLASTALLFCLTLPNGEATIEKP
jgi:hypothetical protein